MIRHEAPLQDAENIEVPSRKRMKLPPSFSSGATNVTFQEHTTGREERAAILGKHAGFRGCTIWFTGLSGAGKTTVSFGLEKTLTQMGIPCYGLDGDNIRHGLCKNLNFSKEDRSENIRRVAEVAKILADSGQICLASFISPFKTDRELARKIHEKENLIFIEVHMSTSLEVCELRDPKSLYKKARAGEIRGFTGIDSVYEPPEGAELVLDAETESEEASVERVLNYLHEKEIIPDEAMNQIAAPAIRPLIVECEQERATLLREAKTLPTVEINEVDKEWLQVLSEGWATPLPGFMRERQYLQSLHFGQLLDLKKKTVFPGEKDDNSCDPWPMDEPVNQSIPIVLPLTELQIRKEILRLSDDVPDDKVKEIIERGLSLPSRLVLSHEGRPLAVLSDPELFPHRKEERVARQFGMADSRHPTIAQIRASGEWCLGGDLQVLERITFDDGLDQFRKTPAELREIFRERDADCVFAFQLRNPIHNGHAMLMRETREKLLQKHRNPMLLLHPLGGWTKNDDVPVDVRMRQHEAIMAAGVLDPKWTVLSIFPSPMMYAGPTEVQWHARARIAAGVQAYIVGRDPAGIGHPDGGPVYEPTHGAKVLTMAPGLSHLDIIPFRNACYDSKNKRMGFVDPSRKEDFLTISGTIMRKYARDGVEPPEGFMAPAAWKVLADYYKSIPK